MKNVQFLNDFKKKKSNLSLAPSQRPFLRIFTIFGKINKDDICVSWDWLYPSAIVQYSCCINTLLAWTQFLSERSWCTLHKGCQVNIVATVDTLIFSLSFCQRFSPIHATFINKRNKIFGRKTLGDTPPPPPSLSHRGTFLIFGLSGLRALSRN